MKTIITLYILLLSFSLTYAQSSSTNYKFSKFVNAYNTHDSIAISQYYAAELLNPKDVAKNTKQTLNEFNHSGKLRFIRADNISPTQTELILHNDIYGSWFTIIWILDNTGAYKEHHMRPIRIRTDLLGSGKLTEKQVLDSVNIYISKLTTDNVFAGNVLIAKDNRILYQKSFGKNKDGRPDSLKQQFKLASMGKMFTTVSILQLANANKLSLDDSVGKIMPELKNKQLPKITVRQLLLHTSGMGDYFEMPEYDPMAGKTFGPADYLDAIEKDKPRFAPGKQFFYSNTGYLLLGLIVQKVSGVPFSTYVKDNVCKPAGMTATEPDNGSGGGLSTVNDLLNFARAIKSDKLLNKESNALFMTFHQNDWGFGQEYQELGGEIITGHSGGFISACTELNIYHKRNYTVVILSNVDPPYGHFIADKIKELLIRK